MFSLLLHSGPAGGSGGGGGAPGPAGGGEGGALESPIEGEGGAGSGGEGAGGELKESPRTHPCEP